MTELIMVRHALTLGNKQHRYVGCRCDEPLSERGVAQCREAGVVPFSLVPKVYVSPMLRAQQTAELCFPQAARYVVPDLYEFDFGAFEGKTAHEMEHDEAYRAWVEGWCRGRCPGGESRAGFIARSNAALLSVVREAISSGEQRICVVAHGGTIMAALHAFADGSGLEDDYFGWAVGALEGYASRVELADEGMALLNPQRIRLVADLFDTP